MIALFITVFAVMLATAFLVGCGIGEAVIRREEEEECNGQKH